MYECCCNSHDRLGFPTYRCYKFSLSLLVQLVIVVNLEASKRKQNTLKSGLNWSALMFRDYWFRKGRLLLHLCDDTWNIILEFKCKTYWLLISPINLTTFDLHFWVGVEEGGSICPYVIYKFLWFLKTDLPLKHAP
jgi:hypothetical protein